MTQIFSIIFDIAFFVLVISTIIILYNTTKVLTTVENKMAKLQKYKRRDDKQFEKVSFEQFEHDWKSTFDELPFDELIWRRHKNIGLPKRATTGSAGYDFYSPCDIKLKPGESITIPTGIRVKMNEDWVLQLYPRSGLGFKYRLQLDNTVGIIDSDYYYSDNEGHIFAKITNDTRNNKEIYIPKGTAFMQGIFLKYGITIDDVTTDKRNGGFGSTDRK